MTDDRQPPDTTTRLAVAELLRRMAGGEEAALALLYDGWMERVHTVAFWILHDEDEAQDVVEETFWQAWREAGKYDRRRASGSTWLLMIARSRALDRLRALRRRSDWTSAPQTAQTLEDEMQARNPEISETGAAQRSAQIAAALISLPAEQREAVELAFLSGLSHAEIAARTEQPLGTVKTRIRLAMGKLREKLVSLREDPA